MNRIHFLMVVLQAFIFSNFSCKVSRNSDDKLVLPIRVDSVRCLEHYKGIAGGHISRTYNFYITKLNADTFEIHSMTFGEEKVNGYLDDRSVNTSPTYILLKPGKYIFRASVLRPSTEKFISPDFLTLNGTYTSKEVHVQLTHPRNCFNPDTN